MSMKIVLSALIVVTFIVAFVWFRPYTVDFSRYLWWRVTGPGLTESTVVSGEANIAYKVTGSGQPLVLLHGGLSSSLDWYAQLPTLSERFQVTLIDSRGHGNSSLGVTEISYHTLARDVLAVLGKLELNTVDIAGWSDGGNIALLLAYTHPERVNRIVAISANANPDGLTPDALQSIEGIDPDEPSILSRLLYRWQSPDHASLTRMREEVTQMWKGDTTLSEDQLSKIDQPVLMMIGENDDIALAHAIDMASRMENATLQVIPGVGHNVPQAASSTVLFNMLQFLQ